MDITAVNKTWDDQGDWNTEWGIDWNEIGGYGNMDALGKSKGKRIQRRGQRALGGLGQLINPTLGT